MTIKLTIGSRVITTRNDGEIGTVCGFRTWHLKEQAQIEFDTLDPDDRDVKWIGVEYLTIAITKSERSGSRSIDSNSSMMAILTEI